MKNFNQNNLLDTFLMSGKNEEEFLETIDTITTHTDVVVVSGKELETYARVQDHGEQGIIMVLPNLEDIAFGQFVSEDQLKSSFCSGMEPALWSEAFNAGRMFFYIDNKLCSVSPGIVNDFMLFGIKGEASKCPTYHCVGLLTERFCTAGNITLCTRVSDDGVRKVFALRSGSYMEVKQKDFFAFAKRVLDGKFESWTVDNFLSEAHYEFSDKRTSILTKNGLSKEIIPYVIVSTSDTGDGSVSFSLGWKDQNGQLLAGFHDSATRKHSAGKRNPSWATASKKFEKEVEKLLEKLTILPDQLAELDLIDIKKDQVEDVVVHYLEDVKMNELSKNVGDFVKKYVLDRLKGSGCTAAEIVILMMGSQTNPIIDNLSLLQKKILAKKIAQIPYTKIRGSIQ